jgi:hypothetical protein
VKTELMPNFDFDAFSHDYADNENGLDGQPSSFNTEATAENKASEISQNPKATSDNGNAEAEDKW